MPAIVITLLCYDSAVIIAIEDEDSVTRIVTMLRYATRLRLLDIRCYAMLLLR